MTRRHSMVVFIPPLAGLVWSAAPNAHAQTRSPSSVLDLTDWKLTLPVEAPGRETAREVKQPELHSFSDRFFRVRVDPTGSGGVHCPRRGGHYSRVELPRLGAAGDDQWRD